MFESFVAKHGSSEECPGVPDELIAEYADQLPAPLLEFWSQHGWCSFGDGLLWTVNPSEYADILSEWLPDASKAFAILRTAFGAIVFWDGERARYLDVLDGTVTSLFRRLDFVFEVTLCDEGFLDAVVLQSVFREAKARLGPPAEHECYGFFPAIALGGSGSSDTVQLVRLREHLSILAQL